MEGNSKSETGENKGNWGKKARSESDPELEDRSQRNKEEPKCDIVQTHEVGNQRRYQKTEDDDMSHTDRRKVDAVRLKGDDIEGFWGFLTFILADIDPEFIPKPSYLLDHILGQMRFSPRFANHINMWDMQLLPEQRTLHQMEFMVQDFLQRARERETSLQIRAQPGAVGFHPHVKQPEGTLAAN